LEKEVLEDGGRRENRARGGEKMGGDVKDGSKKALKGEYVARGPGHSAGRGGRNRKKE